MAEIERLSQIADLVERAAQMADGQAKQSMAAYNELMGVMRQVRAIIKGKEAKEEAEAEPSAKPQVAKVPDIAPPPSKWGKKPVEDADLNEALRQEIDHEAAAKADS
jgi:hypothetical protein